MFTANDILLQSLHVFAASVALAFVEIQIEGPNGWAKNLPTWRGQPPWARQGSMLFGSIRGLFRFFSGGNEITGYHFSLMCFLLIVMSLPVSFAEHKLATLILCCGWLAVMSVVWDFLWFVFNSAYGVERFKPSNIAWHPRWLGPMPSGYYGGLLGGGALIAIGAGDPRLTWPLGALALGVQLTGVALSVGLMRILRK